MQENASLHSTWMCDTNYTVNVYNMVYMDFEANAQKYRLHSASHKREFQTKPIHCIGKKVSIFSAFRLCRCVLYNCGLIHSVKNLPVSIFVMLQQLHGMSVLGISEQRKKWKKYRERQRNYWLLLFTRSPLYTHWEEIIRLSPFFSSIICTH